jgi:hypothetical protein
MKKLLILMLVLGLASAANAVVTLGGDTEVDLGGTCTVTIVSSDTTMWGGYIEQLEYLMTGVVATSNAGEQAVVNYAPEGYADTYELEAKDTTDPFDSVVAGIQFNVTVSAGSLVEDDTILLTLYDTDWSTVIDTATVTVVPEPMTIALLGLGGLLLRRRK